MRKLFVGTVLSCFLGIAGWSQSNRSVVNDPPAFIDATLDSIAVKIIEKDWDAATVIDSWRGLGKRYPEFDTVSDLMIIHWEAATHRIMNEEASEVKQTLLLASVRRLSPLQYRDFLDALLGYAETGKLSKKLMTWAIFVSVPKLGGIWQTTWSEPRTQAAVRRAQKLFADEPNMQSHFTRLLSGQLKRDGEEAAKRMSPGPPTPDGLPPKLDAPNAKSQSPKVRDSEAPTANEPSSLTPWLAWVSVIVAAMGLLWLLLKKRRSSI